jgi:hypothetical protein
MSEDYHMAKLPEPIDAADRASYRRLVRYFTGLAKSNAGWPINRIIAEHDIVYAVWPDRKQPGGSARGVVKGRGLDLEIRDAWLASPLPHYRNPVHQRRSSGRPGPAVRWC